MALTGRHTYVGFGFGALQAGLFLYEAFRSGNFRRLLVAEIVPERVRELQRADGFCSVNIAHLDRVETVRLGPIEAYNPAVPEDRERLVAALADAEEIGTAIPSVNLYACGRPTSVSSVLADGLAQKLRQGGPRAVVYTAENHNAAAEMLEELVLPEIPALERERVGGAVQFLNTVIGKMSGFVPSGRAAAAGTQPLATVTPDSPSAFLVEAFNRILISRVRLAGFERGIQVFTEKDDLLPFEEAKLFGHNATHALAAYLAALVGVKRMADLRSVPGFVPFLRDAFLLESGEALVRKHHGLDPLFTADGYREYANDLLERMTNPFLMDTVERVGRDPARKLRWDDRLVGTMRLALEQGIQPRRYAVGAAAAMVALDARFLDPAIPVDTMTRQIWDGAHPGAPRVEALIESARRFLCTWRAAGFPNIQGFFSEHTNEWREQP